MKLTRGISIIVWRYGTLPACGAPELHEASLRVEATAYAACTTPEDASTLLALLNGGLGHWLQANWAGRLLLCGDDAPARAYMHAHPRALGRAPARLPCTRDEHALARHLLTVVCPPLFAPHGLEVRELVITLDPGSRGAVALHHGHAGAASCVTQAPAEVTVWTKTCDKTKFGLVRRQDRPKAPGDE